MDLTKETLIKLYGESFFTILNLIPNATGILDLTGKIVYANKGFEKEYGIKGEDLWGTYIFDFYIREDHKIRMKQYFEKMISGEVEPERFIDRVDCSEITTVQEINWNRIEAEGELIGIIYTSISDSDKAFLQKQVEEKEKSMDLQKEVVSKLRKKMQLALEAANEGIWEWDLRNDEIQYDDRYFEMLGYSREAFKEVDNIWAHLIHPEDRCSYNKEFEEFLNSKPLRYEFKYRLKNASGTWTWILDKGHVIEHDGNGTPVRLIGVHVDITETMKKQKEIEQLKEDLEIAMEVSDVGKWSVDVEKDKAILEKLSKRFHQQDKEKLWNKLNSCITGHSDELIAEARLYFEKHQAYRWVSIKGRVTEQTKNSKAKILMGTYKDINDIKEKEEALIKAMDNLEIQKRHMEELNMNLVDANFELNYTKKLLEIVLKNARVGISKYNIREQASYYDQVCTTIFGYDPSYGTDFPWIDRVLDDYKESVVNAIFDYKGNVVPEYDVKYQFRRPDGKIIWVQEKGEIIEYDDHGNPVILLGSVRDITAQKDFEQLLITAKEDAQRANRLKTDLVSNINHELRTPLTIIMGMAETIMLSETDLEKRKFLEQIVDSSRRLLNLINEILDLSKIESGSMNTTSTKLPIRPFLRNYFYGITHQAEKKGLKTQFIVDKAVPLKLKIDKNKLMQIMNNILGNSLKYTETGEIGLRVTCNGEKVIFYLFDTGIGIESKYKEKIFERFYQIDGSSRRKFNGTGLGLSIVKELVRIMNGEIDVISEKGKGTCFKIAFPLYM